MSVVKAKVLVLNGADDSFVKAEQIAQFKEEMENAGVDYEFVNYPGAKHSFTNPQADAFAKKFGIPLAYIPMTDEFSGVESALILMQSKAGHISHSNSYGFCGPTPLCGKGDVLYILKTHSSWV